MVEAIGVAGLCRDGVTDGGLLCVGITCDGITCNSFRLDDLRLDVLRLDDLASDILRLDEHVGGVVGVDHGGELSPCGGQAVLSGLPQALQQADPILGHDPKFRPGGGIGADTCFLEEGGNRTETVSKGAIDHGDGDADLPLGVLDGGVEATLLSLKTSLCSMVLPI